MSASPRVLSHINPVVRDVAAFVASFRFIGLPIEEIPRPLAGRRDGDKDDGPSVFKLYLMIAAAGQTESFAGKEPSVGSEDSPTDQLKPLA
jgi:hypothetical protein